MAKTFADWFAREDYGDKEQLERCWASAQNAERAAVPPTTPSDAAMRAAEEIATKNAVEWLGYAKSELECHAEWWRQMYQPHFQARARQALDMAGDLEKVIAATAPCSLVVAATRATEELLRENFLLSDITAEEFNRVAAIITRHSPQLHPYERALTVEWDTHNARRHDLITKKRSAALSDDEANELHELQWLAGLKREIGSGPLPAAATTSPERRREVFDAGFAGTADNEGEQDAKLRLESIAEPWICVEEKPCEEAVAVHWNEMITALVAAGQGRQ